MSAEGMEYTFIAIDENLEPIGMEKIFASVIIANDAYYWFFNMAPFSRSATLNERAIFEEVRGGGENLLHANSFL